MTARFSFISIQADNISDETAQSILKSIEQMIGSRFEGGGIQAAIEPAHPPRIVDELPPQLHPAVRELPARITTGNPAPPPPAIQRRQIKRRPKLKAQPRSRR